MEQQIVVVGGTGLVGAEVLEVLARRRAIQVTALVRRPTKVARPEFITERIFDFSSPAAYNLVGSPELPCDILMCCVGTTIRKAGSQEAFLRVDRDIPVQLAASLARQRPSAIFGLVSSIGAAQPRGFYLQTKAAAEAAVTSSGLRYVILRPSLLLGDRAEYRAVEQMSSALARPLFAAADLLGLSNLGPVARLRPVEAKQLAGVLVEACLDRPPRQGDVLEGKDLFRSPF